MASPRYACACGRTISVHSIANHLKTNNHKNWMEVKKEVESLKRCNQELKIIIQRQSGAFN